MTKTKKVYSYPVSGHPKMTADESPAHVGKLRYAVDFIVPVGTPVLASANGIVVEVKDDSDIGGKEMKFEKFGNYIEIMHANKEYSEYEHLAKGSALVKEGDHVIKGQIIAKSGATGWLAHLGPHLHFMVGRYGKCEKDYKTLDIAWKKKLRGR